MSKQTLKKPKATPCFSYTPQNNLPPLQKIKTEWDLKAHYYQSENDPQIEKDAKKYEQAVRAFVKKYKNTDFTATARKLLAALSDSEKIAERAEASKIMRYLSFRSTLNVNDTHANRLAMQFAERFKKLSNEALFFNLRLGETPKKLQQQYLKDETLAKYHYELKTSFAAAKHHLSEPEEKILTLRAHTSSGMWFEATEKIISNRTVQHAGRQVTIPEALELVDNLTAQQKNTLWNKILDEMVQISEFAEHELSAIVNHEKVSDELRKYKKPYSATVLSYENNEQSVESLVEAISTEGFSLSRRFYKLKAKLHNKKQINYVNKYDPVGSLPKPDWEASVEICRDTFYSLDKRYGEIFDCFLQNGHIDVFPKAGKRGGAFMAETIGLPTYVMLNHTDDFKSLQTLAHEVGHAIHAEMSKSQPAIYQGFSTTTAETASTLFEQFVSHQVYQQLEGKHRTAYLHDKICRDITTIQRQIAFFNFELAMHKHIREYGLATREELAKLMQQSLQAYLGPAVEVTERDGYSYVYVPHIRYGFYVYTYTYGHLISNLLFQTYQKNSNYLEKINQFLSAGSSDTVENIFGKIGIQAKKLETFTTSLETHASEIKELEKLVKKK